MGLDLGQREEGAAEALMPDCSTGNYFSTAMLNHRRPGEAPK